MRPTRLVVISDIHLGGEPPMVGTPELLATFIDSLPSTTPAGDLELVIAGDFVDFLALEPHAALTAEPAAACAKLVEVMRPQGRYGCVFDALSRHVRARHRLTILVGNHDVELVLPSVQAALLERLEATPHDVLFVDDGRVYRIGPVIIDHGNAPDAANANDWDGLRHAAASASRSRPPVNDVAPSPGSVFVTEVVAGLRSRYPFVGLIQPEGELLALLLLAFEPTLRSDWGMIRKVWQAKNLAARRPDPSVRRIAGLVDTPTPHDRDLQDAFGDAYTELVDPAPTRVGAIAEWARSWITPSKNSLATILAERRPIPAKRLRQLQVAFRKLGLHEDEDPLDAPDGQFGEEAAQLLRDGSGVKAVVMGHTHLPRRRQLDGGVYLNCGTWTDRFRVPAAALEPTGQTALENFLRGLIDGTVERIPPTYADLLIDERGHLTRADLATFVHP